MPLDYFSSLSSCLSALQGKYPLAKVIKEVFTVIKLANILKKTFSTTFVFGNEGFGRASNGISTQLKKLVGQRLSRMFFHWCAIQVSTHWCVLE